MIGPQPGKAARCLLSVTVLVLLAAARDRYREEFRPELCELGRMTQIPEAASLLRGSVALRQALREREMTDTDHAKLDWRCHLGRHHYVRRFDDNPEVRGQSVLECTRCGKHEDGPALSNGYVGVAFRFLGGGAS